jgi:hypothetical protein
MITSFGVARCRTAGFLVRESCVERLHVKSSQAANVTLEIRRESFPFKKNEKLRYTQKNRDCVQELGG